MWDLMLTGSYTPVQILNKANRQWGFRTPGRKREGEKELATSTIYKLFTNIFYTGLFEWAGSTYRGNHEAMITLEEYDKVQFLLGKEGRPRLKTHDFAYTGIIKCSECGGMIT